MAIDSFICSDIFAEYNGMLDEGKATPSTLVAKHQIIMSRH